MSHNSFFTVTLNVTPVLAASVVVSMKRTFLNARRRAFLDSAADTVIAGPRSATDAPVTGDRNVIVSVLRCVRTEKRAP
ncbi:MAG: hypothetical protein ABSH51_11945, partial [Solirubrobacteraceae bacterium]